MLYEMADAAPTAIAWQEWGILLLIGSLKELHKLRISSLLMLDADNAQLGSFLPRFVPSLNLIPV